MYRPTGNSLFSHLQASGLRPLHHQDLADRPQQAMTDEPNDRANSHAAARNSRLRNALRENLKRRKSQSRGRADHGADSPTASGADATVGVNARQTDPEQES
jgi:hypothetical protein